MLSIIHFRRQLDGPPVALVVPSISVRNIVLPNDVAAWIALRERAMAGQTPTVRPWSQNDFHSEMRSKSWWRCDRTWLAIAGGSAGEERLVGSVTLAMREGARVTVPVVHWLLVDPEWRRRGIGRVLISHLERAVAGAGWRNVELETHAGWKEAVAFYHSMGYAPVRERSPR